MGLAKFNDPDTQKNDKSPFPSPFCSKNCRGYGFSANLLPDDFDEIKVSQMTCQWLLKKYLLIFPITPGRLGDCIERPHGRAKQVSDHIMLVLDTQPITNK
jgi:hypothetical protein